MRPVGICEEMTIIEYSWLMPNILFLMPVILFILASFDRLNIHMQNNRDAVHVI